MSETVLVTGMGLSTSLGDGVPVHWEKLRSSAISVTALSWGDRGALQAQKLSEAAAAEALRDASLWDGQKIVGVDPSRIGCTVSASKPLFGKSVDQISPPDVINQFIRTRFGLGGESRNVVAACATGAYAIALGASWIEASLCEVVLAGSVEPYPHPLVEAGFKRMGVVSQEPMMRPFDQRRSGFVFGEGAGVVVLESARHARSRRDRSYVRLSGWGLGSDAHSAFAFNSNGQHIAQVISQALVRGRMHPTDIQHVNAHGTGTRLNDWIETQALLHAFGPHASRLMISATKASTGHLLGAAGSVELIFTVLALRHQYVPPTATLERPDPACLLDYTPQEGHPARIDRALSLSFGFGGPIGALIVSRN